MLTKEQIIIIVESAVLLVLIVVVAIMIARQQKKKHASKHAVYVKDGVRYTYRDETHTETGGVAVTHREGDVLLEKGTTYVVSKDGKIIPGKYTVLSAQEITDTINIRLGDFVRPYKHDSDIVLTEGETICAVSHSIILR